jgi:hypothetical protein
MGHDDSTAGISRLSVLLDQLRLEIFGVFTSTA